MEAIETYYQKHQPPGSLPYYALRYGRKQPALASLHALFGEWQNLYCHGEAIEAQRAKLHWWHDELGRVYAGRPSHPLAIALMPQLEENPVPQADFQKILDTWDRFLEVKTFPDMAALTDICHAWGVGPTHLYGGIEADKTYLDALGHSLALCHLIENAASLRLAGILVLPEALVGSISGDFYALQQGTNPASWKACLQKLLDQAEDLARTAAKNRPQTLSDAVLFLEIFSTLHLIWAREICAQDRDIFDARAELTPLYMLFKAWRISRQIREDYAKR